MVFFKCPADRRQISIVAERIFDKQKPLFMEIYNEITVKPYSYVLIDNKADTAVHRQIISGVFGTCVSYALPSTSKSQTLEKRPAAKMSSEQDIAQNTATRILQIDERFLIKTSGQWSKTYFEKQQVGETHQLDGILIEFISTTGAITTYPSS